jgi:hypothetical protein
MKYSPANVKIKALSSVPAIAKYLPKGKKVYSFDLLSGHSCPFANECLSKVVETPEGFRIQDGPNTEFRCFSASQEVIYTNVRKLRSANFSELRGLTTEQMCSKLLDAMPKNLGVCRISVAGDFFNQSYFDAWLSVALNNPDKLFYAYTKSLPYWVNRIGMIPENFVLTASKGGRKDEMIEQYNLRSVQVVYSTEQAELLGLEIDHTDEHAANPEARDIPFCLMIHGVQPKGSAASFAIKELKRNGTQFAYSR